MMQPADSSMRTINRICDILNCFSEFDTDLTLTEISKRIGIPKSTTHRLLEALKSQGIIMNEQRQQNYRLGYLLVRWGTLAQNSLDIRNVALPIMHTLTRMSGESSVLSLRNGNSGVWVEMVESDQPVRLALRIGKSLQLHAGASSKVLWAFLPEEEREQILQEIELTKLAPNTIIDKDTMRQELQQSQQQGYVTSFEETDPDVMGIAAPVYDHLGNVAAGIGIVAPIIRVPPGRVAEIAPYIVQAGQDLSKLIGASKNRNHGK